MSSKNDIIRAVNEILREYNMPLTLRQIYYRLVAMNLIENKLNSYKALSRMLVEAREKGLVPEHMIEDRARSTHGGDWGYRSPEQFVQGEVSDFKECWQRYTRPLWETQGSYIEVWVEKDALSRLVSDVADRFRVKTCVGRGYSSYTYVRDAVNRFKPMCEKVCTILYFGDHDPSGLDITRDLGRRMSDYGAPFVDIRRVALLPEQIERYDLPPAPVKMSDVRSAAFIKEHGTGVVELDAVEPKELQRMIHDAIRSEINIEEWNRVVNKIDVEQEQVRESISKIVEGFSGEGEEQGR